MPINQIPFSNLHKNFTISGVAPTNSRLLLFNPVEGIYVKSVDSDDSGNFNFGSINSSVPLQIKLSSLNDFNCISTSEIVEPAVTINTLKGKCILTVVDMYSLNRSGYLWAGAPKVIFVDQNGNGTGASMTINLASVGQTHFDGFGFQPFEANDPLGNPVTGMSPILNFSMTNFGSNYNNPICFIRGIRGNANFNYETESYDSEFVSVQLSVTTVGSVEVIQNENDFLSNVTTRYGQSNTWGNFGGQNNTGQRLLVQIPGYSNINYNVSCNTADNTQPGPVLHTNLLNQLKSAVDLSSFYGGKYALAYYSIIYGQDPNNIEITGFPGGAMPDSAVDAFNRGLISKQELDVLKGYFGKELLVGGVLNIVGNQLTNTIIASILLLTYNIAQGVIQTSILQEMGSVYRQGKGVLEFDMSGRVRTILTKMQSATGNNYIDNLRVKDNNNIIHQWNFLGSAPTSTVL